MRTIETITALAIALGLTLTGATTANAAPPKKPTPITHTCKAGEWAGRTMTYGITYNVCINTTTRKVRIVGYAY